MTTLTEGIQTLEWLLTDEGAISVDAETVTVAGSVALPTGTVLGKITATGKWIKQADGSADGSQVPAGILRASLAGVNGDYEAAVYKRMCEVIGTKLNGGAGVTAGQNALLKTATIVVR